MIHMILMSKGGVGKSLVAVLLSQFLKEKGIDLFCADTDPTNPTFADYKALDAEHVNVMTPKMHVNRSRYDDLMEKMIEHTGDSVVDNGSSSYLAVVSYLLENHCFEYLRECGKQVIVHAVLVGGAGMDETIRALDSILGLLKVPVVVWENEILGPVQKNGKCFVESALYQKYMSQILGVVRIPQHEKDTYGEDILKMTSLHLTFDEVMASSDFRIMSKQRLKNFKREIFEQLDKVSFIEGAE